MTPQQFAYWLQGYAEINGGAPNEEQWQIIRDHLALVFDKVTPEYRGPSITPSWAPQEIDWTPRCNGPVPERSTVTC